MPRQSPDHPWIRKMNEAGERHRGGAALMAKGRAREAPEVGTCADCGVPSATYLCAECDGQVGSDE